MVLGIFTILFTAYLLWCAAEDYKTCLVRRGKHLSGLVITLILYACYRRQFDLWELGTIFLEAAGCLVFAYYHMYGLADGFVLGNMTFFWAALCGVYGIGITFLTELLAGAMALIFMLLRDGFRTWREAAKARIAFIPFLTAAFLTVVFSLILLYFFL